MKQLQDVLSQLEARGGKLILEGNRIRYQIPKDDPEVKSLLQQLREGREGIARLLRSRTKPNETGNQKRSTRENSSLAQIHELHWPDRSFDVCWHCQGEGQCSCITCGFDEFIIARGKGPCLICEHERNTIQ